MIEMYKLYPEYSWIVAIVECIRTGSLSNKSSLIIKVREDGR